MRQVRWVSRVVPLATVSTMVFALSLGCGSSKSASGSGGITGLGGALGLAGMPAVPGTGGAAGGSGLGGGTAGKGPGGLGGGAAGTGAGGLGGRGTAGAGAGGLGGSSPVPGQIGPLTFAISPTGPDRFYGVTYSAAGNIFAVGQVASSTDTTADIATVVAKFSPTGVPDPTFGDGGVAVRNLATGTNGELCRNVVVQSTGKIIVAGTVEHPGAADTRDRDVAVARFNADGTKDATFGVDGIATFDLSTGVLNGTAFSADSAWGLAVYPDDRLVVGGGQVRTGGLDTDFFLLRLKADGTRDAAFGTNGLFTLDTQIDGVSNNASPRNVTILPGTDGVIGAGYQPVPGADTKPVVYRVSDAGVLDVTFGTGGVFSQSLLADQTETYQVAVQPTLAGGYNLVTTGYGRQLETETTDLVSLRLSPAGVLDSTYGMNGLVRIDIGGFGDNSRRLLVLPDRRIMLVGGGRSTASDVDGVVAVLTPDGVPDATFAPAGWRTFDLGGPADFLWSVALSPDSKTAAIVGIKGVGTAPAVPTANDDAALLLLSVP